MAGYEVRLDVNEATWDEFADSQGHLLQLSGWGRLKSSFGWSARRILVTNHGAPALGAQVLFRKLLLGPMAYVPRGPVGSDEGAWPFLIEGLRAIAAEEHASFLKIEPSSDWASPALASGFRHAGLEIQPKTTITLDLSIGEDALLTAQKPKTRYNVRLAGRRGVVIREGDVEDVPVFYQLSDETAERDGFALHRESYYRTVLEELKEHSGLFVAEYKNKPIASIIVAATRNEAVYLYGASSNQHRNLMPNHALQWHAMRWAISRGCTRYDLWGIPDDAAEPDAQGAGGLWGVYRFKQGFGGRIEQHPGAFDLAFSTVRYALWRAALKAARRLRRDDDGAFQA